MIRNPLLFIAGPMSGYPDRNEDAFCDAERRLQAAGMVTLNPVIAIKFAPGVEEDAKNWHWQQRSSIRMLTYATGLALLPGWEDSSGVGVAINIATIMDIEIRTVDDWISHVEKELSQESPRLTT